MLRIGGRLGRNVSLTSQGGWQSRDCESKSLSTLDEASTTFDVEKMLSQDYASFERVVLP